MAKNSAILSKKKSELLLDELVRMYPDARCALDYKDEFNLLIATVLSAQTTDVSVNKVTPTLFKHWPNAIKLAGANHNDVESVLKSLGMYRQKTKNIIALSRIILEDYNGKVPDQFEELVKLPGVGRKTANVVLSEVFGGDKIAVDTHVFRVANRTGLCQENTPDKVEDELMKRIAIGHRAEMHHCMIWHGRRICHARKPLCNECGIADLCKKNGV